MHVLAAEGGPINVRFGSSEMTALWVVFAVALVALLFAYYLVREVLAASEGTDKMKEIARAIQEGSRAYMSRQFSTLGIFLAGLVSMARFSQRERRWGSFVLNAIGAAVVGFTLVVNLGRGYPIVSLTASVAIAGILFGLWVRAGRPRGISEAEALAEEIVGEELEIAPGP